MRVLTPLLQRHGQTNQTEMGREAAIHIDSIIFATLSIFGHAAYKMYMLILILGFGSYYLPN